MLGNHNLSHKNRFSYLIVNVKLKSITQKNKCDYQLCYT